MSTSQITPPDRRYEEARRVHNGPIDRRPRFLFPSLAVIAAGAVAIMLALTLDGSSSNARGKADGVPPGSGVSLGRDPEVQLWYHRHGSARAGQPIAP
jgi:hypothetical protein